MNAKLVKMEIATWFSMTGRSRAPWLSSDSCLGLSVCLTVFKIAYRDGGRREFSVLASDSFGIW
jgi:hypothetical protein